MPSLGSFSIPDAVPAFEFSTDEYKIANRVILGISLSAGNLIFAALQILFIDLKTGVKWSIFREIVMILSILQHPVHVALNNWLSAVKLIAKYSWSTAILATIKDALRLCSFILLSILLVLLFPEVDHRDYEHHPWHFCTSYFFFVGAIFLGMKLMGTIISNFALQEYGKHRLYPRLFSLLQEGTSIAILINALTSWNDPEKMTAYLQYQKHLIGWCSIESQLLARDRIRKITLALLEVDTHLLASNLWDIYDKVIKMNPTIQWIDFADALIARCKASEKSRLLDPQIRNSDDLEAKIDETIDDLKRIFKEISEHDHLFRQLGTCFDIVSIIILLVVILPLIGFSPNSWLLPLGLSITPSLIALTVVFGVTIATMIEALVFTFYRHPFDVGDEIRIDSVYHVVNRIGILFVALETTQCIRVYYPTSLMMQKTIVNLTRSSRNRQQLVISLSKLTSSITFTKIRQRLMKSLQLLFPDLHVVCTMHDISHGIVVLSISIDFFTTRRPLAILKEKSKILDTVVHELQTLADPFVAEIRTVSFEKLPQE